jgi:hypothetical protein
MCSNETDTEVCTGKDLFVWQLCYYKALKQVGLHVILFSLCDFLNVDIFKYLGTAVYNEDERQMKKLSEKVACSWWYFVFPSTT